MVGVTELNAQSLKTVSCGPGNSQNNWQGIRKTSRRFHVMPFFTFMVVGVSLAFLRTSRLCERGAGVTATSINLQPLHVFQPRLSATLSHVFRPATATRVCLFLWSLLRLLKHAASSRVCLKVWSFSRLLKYRVFRDSSWSRGPGRVRGTRCLRGKVACECRPSEEKHDLALLQPRHGSA